MTSQQDDVVLEGKFDLGYLVRLSDGSLAQLRAPEMKGDVLVHHLESKEAVLFGSKIVAYVIYRSDQGCLVSQFTDAEREERERIKSLRAQARALCQLGQIYQMSITQDYEWGYLCEQTDGYLTAAIKKPSRELKRGELVTAVVSEISVNGAPYMILQDE